MYFCLRLCIRVSSSLFPSLFCFIFSLPMSPLSFRTCSSLTQKSFRIQSSRSALLNFMVTANASSIYVLIGAAWTATLIPIHSTSVVLLFLFLVRTTLTAQAEQWDHRSPDVATAKVCYYCCYSSEILLCMKKMTEKVGNCNDILRTCGSQPDYQAGCAYTPLEAQQLLVWRFFGGHNVSFPSLITTCDREAKRNEM